MAKRCNNSHSSGGKLAAMLVEVAWQSQDRQDPFEVLWRCSSFVESLSIKTTTEHIELQIYELISLKSCFIGQRLSFNYVTTTTTFFRRYPSETRPSPEVVFEGGPDLFAHSVLGPHIKNIRGRKGRPKRAFKEVFCEIICASKSTSSQGQLATRSRPIVHCTHCGVTGREIKGDPRFLSSSTLSPSPSSECVFTVRAKPNTKGLFHSLMRFYCNSDSSG